MQLGVKLGVNSITQAQNTYRTEAKRDGKRRGDHDFAEELEAPTEEGDAPAAGDEGQRLLPEERAPNSDGTGLKLDLLV